MDAVQSFYIDDCTASFCILYFVFSVVCYTHRLRGKLSVGMIFSYLLCNIEKKNIIYQKF